MPQVVKKGFTEEVNKEQVLEEVEEEKEGIPRRGNSKREKLLGRTVFPLQRNSEENLLGYLGPAGHAK